MINFVEFKKKYGAFTALQISQQSIPPGIHWLKGQNGSGKTTLLKCLAGLLPFSGNISLYELNAQQQRIGYREQVNYGEAEPLYPEFLSARDLIQFVAKTRRAQQSQIDSLGKALGVQQFLYQPCGSYSSGMLKKLSLVLALLGSSKLVLLDEPLITLDTSTVDQLYALIRHYASAGRSFLLSSHQEFPDGKLPINRIYEVRNKTIYEVE